MIHIFTIYMWQRVCVFLNNRGGHNVAVPHVSAFASPEVCSRHMPQHAPSHSNALQYVRVTGTKMATRCSRHIRSYSKEQLGARSICLTFEDGAFGAILCAHACEACTVNSHCSR